MMDSSLSVEPRGRPQSGEKKSEPNSDDAEHDFENALVRVETLAKVAKECAKAHEDQRETRDERNGADKRAAATRATLEVTGRPAQKCEVARHQRKNTRGGKGDKTGGDSQRYCRKE